VGYNIEAGLGWFSQEQLLLSLIDSEAGGKILNAGGSWVAAARACPPVLTPPRTRQTEMTASRILLAQSDRSLTRPCALLVLWVCRSAYPDGCTSPSIAGHVQKPKVWKGGAGGPLSNHRTDANTQEDFLLHTVYSY